jgi:hypothetical protein
MKFYFLNWIQLSYDFGKVVRSGTTQGKVADLQFTYNQTYKHVHIHMMTHVQCINQHMCILCGF